ncbi:hypothetical protein FOC4_g10013941 [Fusarium odoratissimum]|uniref:Uncharacterized protein n=2 Tax=Fusarium oxysporum species complex TaxID=171631 RepID=N1RN66_FUSC4|nr:hypothetical protein FOC4_g10013941 [Fusarium odoratissimum]TXC01502.1 hypothetical protein FocTR4_00008742 [Fusarium oxysporum f. sp. cubense]
MSATLLFQNSITFVQGPVIILDLRDLPIEASYPVRGEGQVITVNRFTQHGIESHRLRHSLQVVPSRALGPDAPPPAEQQSEQENLNRAAIAPSIVNSITRLKNR